MSKITHTIGVYLWPVRRLLFLTTGVSMSTQQYYKNNDLAFKVWIVATFIAIYPVLKFISFMAVITYGVR